MRLGLCVLVLAAVTAVLAFTFAGEDPGGPMPGWLRGGDLVQFWNGGRIVSVQPESLYAGGIGQGYHAVYPPPLYQLFARLQGFAYTSVAKLLLLATALAFGLGAWLLVASESGLAGRELRAWALLWASVPLVLAMAAGQPSGFWLLALAGGALLWRRGARFGAGFVWGFLCLKPTLGLAAVLALLATGSLRTFGGFVAGGAWLLAISLGYGGLELWRGYATAMLDAAALSQKVWVAPERRFTLWSLLGNPVGGTRWELPLGALGGALGLALTLWTARRARPLLADPELAFLALGAVFSAALLSVPYILGYDLGMHAIGLAGSLALLWSRRARWPRAGAAFTTGAFVAALFYPFVALTGIGAGTLALAAWVVWMARELEGAAPKAAVRTPLAAGGA